jgi:hypothetical protein
MADYPGIAGDEIKQVQEYVRREFNALLRPLRHSVYHYTNGAAAAAILDLNRLRATNVIYLDEGQDISQMIGFLRTAMERLAGRDSGGASIQLNRMIERYLADTVSYAPPDLWIATFAADRDSGKQWHRIDDDDHGVALGFTPAGITRAADASGALLAPCCYDDDVKLAIVERGLEMMAQLFARRAKRQSGGDGEPLARYFVRELVLFGALMKPAGLAHEDEWRLILCNPCQTAAGLRRITAQSRPSHTALYIDLEIADSNDRLPIDEIIIGPSPHQLLTVRAFRMLLYKHGYARGDVTVARAAG